eukprot:1895968-Rhodomonas_salina.2
MSWSVDTRATSAALNATLSLYQASSVTQLCKLFFPCAILMGDTALPGRGQEAISCYLRKSTNGVASCVWPYGLYTTCPVLTSRMVLPDLQRAYAHHPGHLPTRALCDARY